MITIIEIILACLIFIIFISVFMFFIWSFCEMITPGDSFLDIFGPYKALYRTLRFNKKLNFIGALLPLIFMTPLLIPAMIVGIIINIITIIIKNVIVGTYCYIFKERK